MKDQPEFPALALLVSRGCSHQMHGNANERRLASKATIDVPIPGTIIEQNGDELLEDSHMPVRWRLRVWSMSR